MKRSLVFLFIFILPTIISARQSENWTKILGPKEVFAALLPSDFLIDNEDDEYRVYAYQNEVIINIQIQEGRQSKNHLTLMRRFGGQTEAKISSFTLGNFEGDVYVYEKEKSYSVSMFFASPGAFYSVWVSAKDNKNPTLEKFLYSIRLDNQQLFTQENPANLNMLGGVSITSLKTSPIILEALKKKHTNKIEIKYAPEDEKDTAKTEDTIKYSRPLITLRKPKPNYTMSARENGVEGKVRLRVLFKADGQIGEITILHKLAKGLTEQATDAVRKIKFLPAEIDGKPVDITKIVEYNFNVY